MDENSSPHYDVFISSCFWDYVPGDADSELSLTPVREDTRLAFESERRTAWTWEKWEKSPEADQLKRKYKKPKDIPTFSQIAVYRRALMDSRVALIFVSQRRGQQVSPWADDLRTYGTHFEMEVFFAIALGKPIILFREEGALLAEPLEKLLAVAVQCKAVYHQETIKRRELPRKAVAAYLAFETGVKSRQGWFTALLARRRDPVLNFTKMAGFLDGISLPHLSGHPDLDVVDRLLAAETEPNLLLSERMSRLWLAVQEMLPHREFLAKEPPLLERWLTALDRWSSAASWFGLHAHLLVSPLTTHAERAKLIVASRTPQFSIPYGPMASARYSIARREALGLRRRREMNKVIADSKSAIEAGGWDEAGALAIMGHALIYNGRLSSAADAFERGLALREQERDEARIGEGQCDLGFAIFLTDNINRGIRMMEDGIALLERTDAIGFYLKSMKKLELAYRLTRRREEALAAKHRRAEKAMQEEFFDQAG